MKRPSAPVRVGNRTFWRSRCRSCREICLEKFSRNPSESSPENRQFQFLFKIMYFGKIFQEFSWVMTQNPSNGLWKYFPENLLIHHPYFSMWSILSSNIWKRLFTRFTVTSCLGAPACHLLMLHDLFQLSSMVTSQESKNFFLEKFSRKPPDSCPDNLSIWVKLT